ncbi:MAG: ATP-binding protein [Phycisphaerales bacterium JB060]
MNKELRNPGDPVENLAIGTIVEVDGTHLVAELDPSISELTRVYAGDIYAIGQFGSIIRIHFGRRIIYGYVCRLRMKSEYDREHGIASSAPPTARIIEADLFGEGEWGYTEQTSSIEWKLNFERGVSTFPLPQQKVYLTPKSELGCIFGQGGSATVEIGEHVGAGGTPCYADMNELLGKHTAVLGSTGAGKSGTVAAILHCLLERGEKQEYEQWNPRIVLLDPHNEYGDAFPGHQRLSTDEGTLSLPYWMLSLDETIGLLIGKAEDAATSQSNIVKSALLDIRQQSVSTVAGVTPDDISVDSPIPYILGDPTGLDDFGKKDGADYDQGLVGAINRQRPDNKNKKDHEGVNKVLRKLSSLLKDARLNFMMHPWNGEGDPLPDVVAQFMGDGDPIRIVDLSGVPNEVAGAASSLIARTLFSVKLWQTTDERKNSPVLLVCEEAHRYVPNRGEAQYEAAQEAIRRLAKEGRKYGIGLMLVSQRPSEVEATVLSQCNSWLVLRITNDADRDHVRSILPDSLSGLTKVLSGLRWREAIFVGQAAMLPSRILIRHLDESKLPRSHDINFDQGWQCDPVKPEKLLEIGTRWRLQQRSRDATE